MKRKNLSILLAAALVAVACSDNSENPSVEPTPGVDVQFGATLGQSDLDTRTYYGDETQLTVGGSRVFPIYWQSGDQVRIISPDCEEGFQDRTYQVDADHEGKDYAETLQKTTDTGLRWGTESQASFYSIYPASGVTSVNITNKTFTLTMPSVQTDTVKTLTDAEAKTTYTCAPQMDGCFMYAYTPNVVASQTVDLRYKPLSTAIRFTLTGPDGTSGTEESDVVIEKVTLRAPTGTYIAGDFTVDLSSGTPSVSVTDGTNEVALTAFHEEGNARLTLGVGETVELNAFIIPQDDLTIGDDWSIEVEYATGISYQLSLAGAATTGKTAKLTAGKIHRLKITKPLPSYEWDLDKWMTYIHDKVYLSEVSMPGSWNSLNSNFQSNTSISDQYSNGIRAFHLDTRWRAAQSHWTENIYNADDSDVGDLSVADNSDTHIMKSGYTALSSSLGKVMVYSTATFKSRLEEITNCVKSDEYMVVMCTFANDSYTRSDKTWVEAVSEACDDIGETVIDASKIDKNTTVGEVEGHVIVIICTDDNTLTLPEGSRCMITYLPNTIESESSFAATQNDLLNVSNTTNLLLYGTQAQITSNSSTAGIKTDERGWAPTIDSRKTLANEILSYSKSNYSAERVQSESYDHNEWLYLGLGGYIVTNTSASEASNGTYTLANDFNPWIKGIIDDMATAKYFYPVGIVLMNHVCEDNGVDAANAIVQLNTRYEMAKKSTTTTSSGVKARTQPTYKSGGNAISH